MYYLPCLFGSCACCQSACPGISPHRKTFHRYHTSTVTVDAAAWQTVVANIYREWDEKDIPEESVPGTSPTQESISSQRSIHGFKSAYICAFFQICSVHLLLSCVWNLTHLITNPNSPLVL